MKQCRPEHSSLRASSALSKLYRAQELDGAGFDLGVALQRESDTFGIERAVRPLLCREAEYFLF
jgi:hypothetical protein